MENTEKPKYDANNAEKNKDAQWLHNIINKVHYAKPEDVVKNVYYRIPSGMKVGI